MIFKVFLLIYFLLFLHVCGSYKRFLKEKYWLMRQLYNWCFILSFWWFSLVCFIDYPSIFGRYFNCRNARLFSISFLICMSYRVTFGFQSLGMLGINVSYHNLNSYVLTCYQHPRDHCDSTYHGFIDRPAPVTRSTWGPHLLPNKFVQIWHQLETMVLNLAGLLFGSWNT